MKERSQKRVWHLKIHQNRCVWKKLHKTSKDKQDLDVTCNKCGNFFLTKMLQRLRLPRNKEIPKNWHIFMRSTVRTLIFHILPLKTCSLNISKKVPKIWKIVVYFEVTSSRNIFCRKIWKDNSKKMLALHQKQNKTVLLHMSWLILKLETQ